MQFSDPIASGLYLVREALRSPNYVAGTSGWTVNEDGSAEFNNATFRGDVIVDGPLSRVDIRNDGTQALEEFWGLYPPSVVTDPAKIVAYVEAWLSLQSMRRGTLGNIAEIRLECQHPSLTGAPTTDARIRLLAPEVEIGESGILNVVTPYSATSHDSTTRSTAATGYTALGTASLTKVVPKNGFIDIEFAALMNNSGAATDAGFMSYEIRANNSGGAVMVAASDLNAIRLTGAPGFTSKFAKRTEDLVSAGLSVDGVYFIRPMFRSSIGTNTASFDEIDLAVKPVI